jgi:glycosyltransferase involved in cell wall biosynthesis
MKLLIDLQGAQGRSSRRGIGRLSKELALAMARRPRGHTVEIALNAAYGQDADDLASAFDGLLPRSQILVWSGPGTTADIDPSSAVRRMVAEQIRAQAYAARAPDVVHVSSLFEGMDSDIVPCWPRSVERPPMVATFYDAIPLIRHEQYLDGMWRLSGLSGPYLRRVQEARLCDGLLAISQSSRQEAVDYIAMPAADVFNIGAGVGPAFRPVHLVPDARAALLRRYGLRDGFILFLGAGDIRKNEAGLLAGYARLPEPLRARHQLVIVGGTPAHASEMDRHGLARDAVVTVPFVEESDMPALYSTCTLFALPSLHEGFGLPAAEAMACGAPVIASNTTSLPEVVGRADALFDPEDPADIAARMEAVLCDESFRRALVEHGPVQSSRFTWEACADRAWTAIEAVYDRRSPRAPRSVLATRLRLAFVSPLPPDESGIADYSRDLLPALARHYEITLVTPRGSTSDPWLAANFPVIKPPALLDAPEKFDRILYQLGNSHYHLFQLHELLPALPGTVVLHDGFLSGLLAFDSHQPGRSEPFSTTLYVSHGYPAVATLIAEEENAAVQRYPCCLPAIQGAIGVIQHSEHARSVLADHFGPAILRDARLVPFPRRPLPPLSRKAARQMLGVGEDLFLVCSFGMVAPTKLPERLLAAWERAGFALPDARLVFVGNTVGAVEKAFRDRVARTGAAYGDVIQGRVSEEIYAAWLAAADVAVQLRAGSRGESSKSVADCLAAGLPTIVNRHGSMTEVPDGVAFVLPDAFTDGELAEALRTLSGDETMRRTLGAAGHHYWETELHPDACARRYHEAIEASYATGPAATSAAVLSSLRASPPAAQVSSQDLLAAAQALSRSFPVPRPAQLLLDVTDLEQEALDPPIDESLRALFAAWLGGHPPHVRVEPVRIGNGRCMLARGFAWTLLGFRMRRPADQAADLGPDSVILFTAATWSADRHAVLGECRRRGARLVLLRTEPSAEPPAPDLRDALNLADLVVTDAEAANAFFRDFLAGLVPGHRVIERTTSGP